MAAAWCRRDHHARPKTPNHARQPLSRRWIVDDSSIGKIHVFAGRETHNFGGAARFGSPCCRRPARPHLALREIDNRGSMSLPRCFDQRSTACELDVVAMRGDGEEVHFGHWSWIVG